MNSRDHITIAKLELDCRLGVPDEERVEPQRVLLTVRLYPLVSFAEMGDDLNFTIDYAAVSADLRSWAAEKPVKLIETLADSLAHRLIGTYPLQAVEMELRKFILPETEYVAVTLKREAGETRH